MEYIFKQLKHLYLLHGASVYEDYITLLTQGVDPQTAYYTVYNKLNS